MKIKKNIALIYLSILLSGILHAAEALSTLTSTSGTNAAAHTFSNQNSEITPSDLEQLVGLRFAWQENQSFKIHGKNSKGENVGIAYFRTKEGGSNEEIAWYWNSVKGFQVIAAKSYLRAEYATRNEQHPFQFYKLLINESGIVAGSFLIDQAGHPDKNRCPWFWWSYENGIHLSPIPDNYQLIQSINNYGEVLISQINRSGFIVDINNNYSVSQIEYPDWEIMRQKIKEAIPVLPWELREKVLKNFIYKFCTLNAESNDDTGKVFGTGTWSAINFRTADLYTVILNFKTSVEGLKNLYVKDVIAIPSGKSVYQTHSLLKNQL